AAVGRNPRDAAQAELPAPVVRIARRHGNGAQAAVGVVSPAVIRAHKAAGAAASLGAYDGAAMHAAVDQHAHRAVALARDDHRLAAHAGGEVIARRGDLAVVPEDQPGAAEDALHLEFEDRRIGVHRALHPVGLHQHRKLFAVQTQTCSTYSYAAWAFVMSTRCSLMR